MALASWTENLRTSTRSEAPAGGILGLLLHVEAWLDARASRKVLHSLDERALADIGLTRADLERSDSAASWQSLLSRRHRPAR